VQPTQQTGPTLEKPQIAQPGFFTIGSASDEVLAVEGPPSARNPTYWRYGLATVDFNQQGRVVGWANADSKLHVSLAGAKSTPGKVFTVNSSRAEVAAVQGVPTGYYPTYWRYGLATVDFTGDRVSGWANADSVLQVSMAGASSRPQDTFSIGASRSDVAAVQGVPSGYYPTYWRYGLATVDFAGDRVSGWANAGSVLRLFLPGAGTRQQDRFSMGASRSDVAAVQGVPSGYYPTYWRYGLATVDFEGDRVKSWTNSGNTLRVNN
jgi:hypothetical protein